MYCCILVLTEFTDYCLIFIINALLLLQEVGTAMTFIKFNESIALFSIKTLSKSSFIKGDPNITATFKSLSLIESEIVFKSMKYGF